MRRLFPYAVGMCCAVALLIGCDAVRLSGGDFPEELTVEVAVFEGGYGVHWHLGIARRYEEEMAAQGRALRVDLWGDPRLSEKIKPRILRGDPPDVVLMHELPIWLLIAAGKILPFDDVLDQPALDAASPWRDLFMPGMLSMYQADGKTFAIPSAIQAWACWYDARLFRRHGWTPPATWTEFVALCDRIQAAGIAPLAFQGKYPGYAWFTFISLVQRCGGLAAINRINFMEEGAFSHPDVVWAASLLQDMSRTHFQRGAMAMTHTESQLQFVNNQAALIFCGLWLHNEMKASTPPGFEMRCFTVPAVEGGKGNPRLVNGAGSEFLFVPADARRPEEGFAFARYMVSLRNASGMGAAIGVLSPLHGGTPREAVDPPLQSAMDMIDQAEAFFYERTSELLLEWMNQVMQPNLAALLRGELTPDAYCAALDRGMAEAKKNPDLIIRNYMPFNPIQFGEKP
ncbi:MAG TPA: extracellular solute-binding protein [Candidatus Hydrogenedentes bacterium]|nr:extracellular solute-binding protein [Candidatus Hydrogenedentota bacterium]